MIYGLETFDVDVPDDRLNTLNTFYKELLDSHRVSQYDITMFENKMRYNVITKFLNLKSFTVVPSATNFNKTLYYLKQYREEYNNIKKELDTDKSNLTEAIYKLISDIKCTLVNIRDVYGKLKDGIDLAFASEIGSRVRNSKVNFNDLVKELDDYSKYCEVNGIKDNFFNVSEFEVLIKLFKYEDLSIFNILNKVPIEFYCIDVYKFFKSIMEDESNIDMYIYRLEMLIQIINNNDFYTFEQYKTIVETLETSYNFVDHFLNYYGNAELFGDSI